LTKKLHENKTGFRIETKNSLKLKNLEEYKSMIKLFSNYKFRRTDYVNLGLTILFYIGFFGFNSLFAILFPIGFSVHDLGSTFSMLFMLLTVLTSLFLFIRTFMLTIKKDKRYILALLVHIIIWVGYSLVIILEAKKTG
jgi:apolipoprotein N-acyltransferase